MVTAEVLAHHVLAASGQVLAASSDESGNGPIFVIVATLVVGIGFYWGFANYYRNANARFRFEDRTTATVTNVRTRDDRIDHRTGLRSSSMEGHNEGDATAAVRLQVAWPEANVLPEALAGGAGGGGEVPAIGEVPPPPPPPPAG